MFCNSPPLPPLASHTAISARGLHLASSSKKPSATLLSLPEEPRQLP